MATKRYPRRISVQRAEAGNASVYLRAKLDKAAVNSGCMRGNDTYGKNGSASVGTSPEPVMQVNKEQSYSDFMNFNYGPLSQRHNNPSEER